MKSWLTAAILLVLLAAAGYGLWFVLQGDKGDDPDTFDAKTEDQKPLVELLDRSQWLVDESFAPDRLRARITEQKVTLTEEQFAGVLPLLEAHLRKLRANLEAAHAAAGEGKSPAQRARYMVVAVRAHADLQAALREHVDAPTAKALFDAFPRMLPPAPTKPAPRPPQSREPTRIDLPAPEKK